MENLMETTAWSMLHSLWIGALLYGLLQLGLYIIGHERAAWRSMLAYLALFGIFAGFAIVFWSNFRFSISPGRPTTNAPFPDILFLLASKGQEQGVASMLKPYFPYLASGYTAGLLFQLIFLTLGLFRVRGLRKKGLLVVPKDWQQLFEATQEKMGISRKISLFLSTRVTTPIVVGFLKPMVLIPVAIINNLDLQQAELILLHELAHIRRHDYLLNLLKTFIEAILFFNPFVWLCGRIIQAERENACDDMVLQISSRPVDYAHTLFRVAAHSARQKPSLALGAAGQHKYHLLQRIKRITNMNTKQKFLKQPLLAMLLAMLVAASLAWVKPQKAELTHTVTRPHQQPARPLSDTINKHAVNSLQVDTLRDSLIPSPPAAPKPADPAKPFGNIPEPVTFNWDDQSLKMDSLSFNLDSLSFKFDTATVLNNMEWKDKDDSIKAYFNSPAWRKQVEEIQKLARMQGERARKMSDSISAYYNSPEFKKQMQEIQKQAGLAGIQARVQGEKARKLADSLQAKFNSPEWINKMKEMAEVYNSPEYKKLKKKFDREVDALKKRKLKSDPN